MESKKSQKAALEVRRKYFFQIGVVCGLSIALVGFEWSQKETVYPQRITIVDETETDELPPVVLARRPLVELPAPKPPGPEINPVDEIEIVQPDPNVAPKEEGDLESRLKPIDDAEEFVEEDDIDPGDVFEAKMPEFPGGEPALKNYLFQNLDYPRIAVESGIQGVVHVAFTVDKKGAISNIEVVRGIHPVCDQEAIRVVKNMPLWVPGEQRGMKVAVRYQIPVRFVLK